jgi:dihydrodipicolinate synthase/N-acetylneuraminate lyase
LPVSKVSHFVLIKVKELFPVHGIITVLNTPFDRDNSIDLLALKRNVREALEAGVAGFLVPAMASEVHKLSLSERESMVAVVMEEVDGKIPVFAGTSSGSVDEAKSIIRIYQKLGCTHFLVQLPWVNEYQFTSAFYSLADLGPEVIMLQDWDATGYGLPDELIMNLFDDVPEFRCLKVETVPAGVKYSRILELSEGKMHVSGGWAVMQMPEALQRGVHAFMPTGMHWIYTTIFREYKSGNQEKALQLFREVLPILAFSNQHLDISIHFFKRLLWRQEIYPTPNVRQPALPFDRIHQILADEHIDKIIKLENELKSMIT